MRQILHAIIKFKYNNYRTRVGNAKLTMELYFRSKTCRLSIASPWQCLRGEGVHVPLTSMGFINQEPFKPIYRIFSVLPTISFFEFFERRTSRPPFLNRVLMLSVTYVVILVWERGNSNYWWRSYKLGIRGNPSPGIFLKWRLALSGAEFKLVNSRKIITKIWFHKRFVPNS